MSRPVDLSRCTPDLEELREDHWLSFAGVPPEMLRVSRASLISQAEATDDEIWIATVWDTGRRRVLGLAAGFLSESATGRRSMAIVIAGAQATLAHGIYVAQGEDPLEIGVALIERLTAACRDRSINTVVIPRCSPNEPRMDAIAQRLGFRAMPAPSDNHLMLPPDATYESYLLGLRSKKKNFVRDLRRPEEGNAVMVSECPPSAEALERIWPLQLDCFERKGATNAFNGRNLIALQVQRVPNLTTVLRCVRGDELLGFVTYHSLPGSTLFTYVGHVAEPGLQVYVALVATFIRQEIQRGSRTFFMGETGDEYKRRLGCVSVPRQLYFKKMA